MLSPIGSWYRRQSLAMRIALPVLAALLVAGLAAAIIPRLSARQTTTAAAGDPATAGAHINPPEAQQTPYEQRVFRAIACSPAAGNVYAFTVHSSPDGSGPYIAVHVSIARQPDAATARQVVFADAFALQRAIWQSDLRPSGVGADFAVTFAGEAAAQQVPTVYCQLSAQMAARVDWAKENPAHAWSSVYDVTSLGGLAAGA